MNKKVFVSLLYVMFFAVLLTNLSFASVQNVTTSSQTSSSSASSRFDVSIDRVRVNGNVVAESKTNLIEHSDVFSVLVEFTSLGIIEKGHVEAVLRGRQSSNVVADSTANFDLSRNKSSSATLSLALVNSLKKENDFDITIKIINAKGEFEQKVYGIKTNQTTTSKVAQQVSSTFSTSNFDVSIDRVRANGKVLADSRTNRIDDADVFSVLIDFTAVQTLEKGHVEAVLRGRQSGDAVSDSTANIDLSRNESFSAALTLLLVDKMKREDDFDLTVKIVDVRGRSEQKTFGIRTGDARVRGKLDISIDRVKVNNQVVASSRINFIEETDNFDVLVEFTALEDLEDAHIEAIIRDLSSGSVVADATTNFDLQQDSSASKLLRLELLDKLKRSNSFELTIKAIDSDGNSVQQLYGIAMRARAANGVAGRALDISIDTVEVEDKVVAESENNFVIIGQGKKEIDVRAKLTALENVEDAHVEAVLTFENGDVVSDATNVFDMTDGSNAVKDFELPLIGRFEQDSFRLKIKVIDAEGSSIEKSYGLKLSQTKFPFVVSSVSLNPETNAEAGKILGVTLLMKNSGVVALEGLNAKVSIPELGVSSTKFIEQIRNSGRLSEIREDFVLKLLDNVQTGTYTLRSEISSQFGGDKEIKEIPVFVLGKDDQEKLMISERLVIIVPVLRQDIRNDGSEVIYQFTLTNEGPDANSYTLMLDAGNWANLRLSDSNVFVLKPKETKTINIYASSKENVLGEHIFVLTIKSKDKVLKQIPFNGNVLSGAKLSLVSSLIKTLEVIIIGTIIVLLAIAIFFGLRKIIQNKGGFNEEIPDQEQGEAYY